MRSPDSPVISLVRPAGPRAGGPGLGDRFLDRRHGLVRDALADDLGADGVPGQAEEGGQELDDALRVELRRDLEARLDGRAQEPGDQAGFEVLLDVGGEQVEAVAHVADHVAQEADRVLDDLGDCGGCLGEDAHQGVGQFDDRLDHADHRVLDAVPQALVRLLESGDLLIDRVQRLGVLLRQVLDQLLGFLVHLGFQVDELPGEVLRRLLAEPAQVRREFLDLGLEFGAAWPMRVLARPSSRPMVSAMSEMTPCIWLT